MVAGGALELLAGKQALPLRSTPSLPRDAFVCRAQGKAALVPEVPSRDKLPLGPAVPASAHQSQGVALPGAVGSVPSLWPFPGATGAPFPGTPYRMEGFSIEEGTEASATF